MNQRIIFSCFFGVWLVVWSVFGVSCTSNSTPSASSSSHRLKIQLTADPVTLDPTLAEDGVSLRVLSNTMDRLVQYSADGKLELHLAETIDFKPPFRKLTVTLKSNAKWSDGVPVSADQFVLAIERARVPETGSKLAPLLKPIDHVTVLHAQAFEIYFKKPAPYFLGALTLSTFAPLRKDILIANHGRWPEVSPGTGAYFISEIKSGQSLLLKANPTRKPRPFFSEVELIIMSDESTALHLFEKGNLDVIARIPSYDFRRLQAQGVIRTDPFLATYYLGFNTKHFSVAQRKRIAEVIDRAGITELLGQGETPALTWVPPLLNPNAVAKKALRRDSFSIKSPTASVKTSNLLDIGSLHIGPLHIGYDTSARNTMILEKVQADLKKAGFTVLLENTDWKTHVRNLQTAPSDLYRFGWLSPFFDSLPHLEVFTSHNPNNYTGWSDAKYDLLVQEISELPLGKKRTLKIDEAEKILRNEVPMIPLYHYVQNHAVHKRIKNFRVNPFGVIYFDRITLVQ